MNIMELRDQLNHAVRSMKDLVDVADKDNRPVDEKEKRAIDDYKAQIARLRTDIKKIEDHESYVKSVNDEYVQLQQPEERMVPPARPNNSGGVECERIEFLPRSRKLRSFKKEDVAFNCGAWLAATILGNRVAERRCRERGVELRTAHGTNDNSLGGALVPDAFSQTIIDLREGYGVFRENARIVAMPSDTMNIPRRASGLTAYFVGENSEVTESNKTFDSVNLTARKLAVLTKMSTELSEDSFIDVAEDLAQEAAYQFAYKEDLCGFIGDGTSTYGGIVGIAKRLDDGNGDGSATLLGSVFPATSGHDLFTEVDASDLAKVMGVCPKYARQNAKWYCSQVAADIVFSRLAATAGGNTIDSLTGAYQPRYLGYPIVTSPVLEDALTAVNNTHQLLFGDLGLSSTMGTRREIRVQRLNERYAEYDQIGVLVTQRFDIVNHDYGTSTVAGPVVALIGQTS